MWYICLGVVCTQMYTLNTYMGAGTGVEANEGRIGTGTGAGTGRERGRGRGRGWGPVDEHRMGTGTGTGTEARTVAEMGTETTITGTRVGLGRAEGRRKSARNRKIVVDAARETGETWNSILMK